MALKGKIYSIARQHDDLNTNELFQSMIDKSAAQDTIVMDGRNIAAGSVFAEQIHAGAITADKIRADAITADHMNVGSLSAISTNIGEITTGIIRSRDSDIHINLNTGIIDLSKPLTINSKPVATSEQVTQAVDGVDGKVDALSTRMSNAEIKIEPSAIVTTVTSSTTFKDVQSKASSAKETLDSKSSAWDSKATTGYVDGKAGTAETNAKNYAKQQVDGIEVGGANRALSPVMRGFNIGSGLSSNNAYRTFTTAVLPIGEYIISHKTEMGVRLEPSANVTFLDGSGAYNFTEPFRIKVTKESSFNVSMRKSDVSGLGDEHLTLEEVKFKIEKGNKATDWTPAPEDVQLESDKKTYLPVRYIRDWQNGSTANAGNHWYQIEAYVNGENVARGKTASNATNANRVTDGNRSGSYAGGTGKDYIQVDLGKNYYNVDSVGVWHYHNDGRTYKETMTEVSPDGTNWYPIFDSAVEGEYETSAEGRVFPNTWARYEAVKTPIRLTERVTTAEQKITDDAIRSTVTSSTTFKDVQSKANSAKETLDSKSGTWDSKATTNYVDGKASTAETNAKSHADSKASTAETNAKDYAKKQVDGIEIGGRNLLTETSEEELRVLTSSFAIGAWDPGLTIGEEYTFSFDIKSENATYLQNVFLNSSNSGFVPNHPITKEWTRVQFTFKWEGGTYSGIELRPHVYPRPDYSGTYVTRIKLEKGNKATDWTPAPEDVEEGIESAQSTADDAKSTADTLKNTTVPQLVSRVNTAEQKITDDAIRNTVTSSTTFKDIESKANSAKSTLDSKSKTWDAKIDSSTAEQIAEQKAQEAKSKNFGYRYYESIVIYGDSDKYYPVIIKGGDQNVKRDILIKRGYSEQAPPDWNTSTHKGGLTLKIKTNFGGWGGANYSWEIHELEEMYSRTFAGAQNVMSNMAFAIFLRGGGTTGARYHIYSDQSLTDDRYSGSNGIPISPQIGLAQELIGQTGTHSWNAPKFRTITANVEEEIRKREFIKLSQDTDSEVNSLKTTTIPQLTTRVNTAEQKITDKAIVSTVTESTTYKNDKSRSTIISTINQTAESVSIDASNINLTGKVTISSFGTDVTNKLDDIESDASTAKSTASSAQSTASTAKSTADTANKAASEAKSTAASASSTASTAKTTADNASSTASTAKATADTASSVANTTKSTLDSKAPIWDAKETTSGAQAKATAAETNAKKYVDDNTGNLVNNPAATGNHTGWTGSGLSSLNQTFEGVSTRVLQTATSGNIQYYSSYFKVDPSKAYEVSMWFKKNIANSSGYYLGLNGINASGSTVAFVQTSQSGGTVNSNNTNFYFDNGTAPTDWVKVVGYIMPAGTKASDLKGVGTKDNAIMKPDVDRIRVRFLNWNNAGTIRTLWVANPKVVEVDPNAVIYAAKAQDVADTAKADASSAKSTASSAVSTANSASSTASSALSTANTANSNANTAKADASSAKSTASSASSTANTAKSTADTAKSTADTASSTANTANTTASNALTRVTIHDTRSNNQPPSWYFSNYARQIVQEFKNTSTMGIGTSLETYGILLTTVPWTGTSGGSIKQEFKVRDRMYTRDGTGSSWTAWKDALGEAEAAKISAGNAQSTANTASSKADTAQGTADTANTAATNAKSKTDKWTWGNTTEIDGGAIRANTVTANQIAAGSITADKIVMGTGTPNSGNLAAGRTFSGNYTGTVPGNGNNTVGSTFASFGSGGSNNNTSESNYIQVDLGSAQQIAESRTFWYAADRRRYYYKIKYSTNGSTWFYAVGNSANNGWTVSRHPSSGSSGSYEPTIDRFAVPITARYLRIYGNGNTSNTSNHIYEWELYSKVQTTISGSEIVTGTLSAGKITTGTMHANRIQGNTITANHIASNSITTEELNITTLSAITADLGTVTAGTIRSKDNAIDINLDTGTINLSRPLTVNKLPVSTKKEVEDAIQGIEVGGRNLIPSSVLSGEDYTTKEFEFSGWAVELINTEGISNILESGEEYTISYDMELTDTTDVPTFFARQTGLYLFSPGGHGSGHFVYTSNLVNKGDKYRYVKTFTAPELVDHRVLIYSNRYTTNGNTPTGFDTLVVTNLKLEKGNIATDWTEAPEDTQAKIDKEIGELVTVEDNNKSLGEITTKLSDYLALVEQTKTSVHGLVDDDGNLELGADGEPIQGGIVTELEKLLERAVGIENNLGDFTESWNFEVSQITMGEEGLFVGTEGSDMGILIAPDRVVDGKTIPAGIYFMDGGQTIAFISGQMMQINRGIFVQSAQIGEHQIETISGGHTIFSWIPKS